MPDSSDLSDVAADTASIASALDDMSGLSRSVGAALTSAFRGAALEGRALDDVLRSIASRLASSALSQALTPLTTAAVSGLGSALSLPGFVQGAAFSGGRPVPFAQGGVVAAPTYFGMAGGRTGLMGEAGPEAILPLARGPDGRLGVAGEGGTRVTINITTPDVAGFRRSAGQVQTQLARAVGRGRRGL